MDQQGVTGGKGGQVVGGFAVVDGAVGLCERVVSQAEPDGVPVLGSPVEYLHSSPAGIRLTTDCCSRSAVVLATRLRNGTRGTGCPQSWLPVAPEEARVHQGASREQDCPCLSSHFLD